MIGDNLARSPLSLDKREGTAKYAALFVVKAQQEQLHGLHQLGEKDVLNLQYICVLGHLWPPMM